MAQGDRSRPNPGQIERGYTDKDQIKRTPVSHAVQLYKPVRDLGMKTMTGILDKMSRDFARVLPKYLSSERFIRIVLTTLQRPGKEGFSLMDCSARSILRSVMEAAQLGLEVDGTLGHAWLVPFKEHGTLHAQLIVGYRGYVVLMKDAGARDVRAKEVWANEPFELEDIGTRVHLKHTPLPPSTRGDTVRGVYCIVTLPDGTPKVEWMWTEEIEAIRQRSKASAAGPWVTDWIEMAKKTLIRRVAKTAGLVARDGRVPVSRVAAGEEERDATGDAFVDLVSPDLIPGELAAARADETAAELADKYKTTKPPPAGETVVPSSEDEKRAEPEPLLPGDPGYPEPGADG